MLAPAASPATHPVIEQALSSAARSSGEPYGILYLNENHSHLGGYRTGFGLNVKGFFCLFLPFFSGIFLDISC